MKRLLTIIAILFVASVTMGSNCVKPSPMPIEPKDTAMCASACDHLRMLGCEEGEALPDGTTCEKFCIDTQKAGHALRPSCVVNIKACADLDAQCSSKSREIFE